jgi:hypothetical protein
VLSSVLDVHLGDAFVLVELSPDLGGDDVNVLASGQLEVLAEDLGKLFGRRERLVNVPEEGVPDPVRVGVDIDPDGDERLLLSGGRVEGLSRAEVEVGSGQVSEGRAWSIWRGSTHW